MRAYLITLLVAAAVTYLLTPVARRVALIAGVCSPVRDRDVHAEPTPRLGGLAMLGGFLAALLVASELTLVREVFRNSEDWRALLSGVLVIFALGVADDKWELDALTKLAGQVLAAGVMVLQGIQLLWVPVGGSVGVFVLPRELGVLLTVLIVLVTMNAVNFVDGLDGLAAGIVGIAALGFFAFSYSLSVGQSLDRATTATLVSAVLTGMCLGFLPHNFWPARVFMGDSGSMMLGLLLAASTISLTGGLDPSAVTRAADLSPALLLLLLPVLVLVVPLVDLLLAVIRRTRAGRSPFSPDKRHLHHRLLEIGHSHRRAVLVMYMWSAVLAFGVVGLPLLGGPWSVVVFVVVALGALAATLNLDQRRADKSEAPADGASA